MAPSNGCHSVIDSPESVKRVAPPTAIMATTSKAITASQTRIRPTALPSKRDGVEFGSEGPGRSTVVSRKIW
ncbi:MAG: hypothetical protein KDJ36_10075 [Hyphomicrobiaceae bacterium]|nr:hypothetical protein [Hyphomicrobiaceae bacterium]